MPSTLDARLYPHIFERVVSFAGWDTLLALRGVSRDAMAAVDKRMVAYVALGSCERPEVRTAAQAEEDDAFRRLLPSDSVLRKVYPGLWHNVVILREPHAPFRPIPISQSGVDSARMAPRLRDVLCVDYYPPTGRASEVAIPAMPNAVVRTPWTNNGVVQPQSPVAVQYHAITRTPAMNDGQPIRALRARGATAAVYHVRIVPVVARVPRELVVWGYPYDNGLTAATLVLEPCDGGDLSAARVAPSYFRQRARTPAHVGPADFTFRAAFGMSGYSPLGIFFSVPDTAAALLAAGVRVTVVGLENVHPGLLGYRANDAPFPEQVRESLVAEVRVAARRIGTADDPRAKAEKGGDLNSIPYGGTPKADLLADEDFTRALENLTFMTLPEWLDTADWRETTKPPIPDDLIGWFPGDRDVSSQMSWDAVTERAFGDVEGVVPFPDVPDHRGYDSDDGALSDDWEGYEGAADEFADEMMGFGAGFDDDDDEDYEGDEWDVTVPPENAW